MAMSSKSYLECAVIVTDGQRCLAGIIHQRPIWGASGRG